MDGFVCMRECSRWRVKSIVLYEMSGDFCLQLVMYLLL